MIVCVGVGRAENKISPEMKATLKDVFNVSLQTPAAKAVAVADDPVLQLETFKVTDTTGFELDIARAARQAAAAREARKFSYLKGGLIYSGHLGGTQYDVGIWPMLVSMNDQLLGRIARNQDLLGVRVDLLRIKW